MRLRDVPHRRSARPRQRADVHRRLLRRGRPHYDGVIAQEKNGGRSRIDSLRPIQMSNRDVLERLAEGRRKFTTAEWKHFLLRPSASSRAPDTRAAGRAAAADGAVRRAQLQHGRARPARNRQEPPVSADLALCPPHLRRQGDSGPDVRQQSPPVSAGWSASTTSSASTRSPASPSTRRTASTS